MNSAKLSNIEKMVRSMEGLYAKLMRHICLENECLYYVICSAK
jgi:hypothetical protein